MEKVGDVTDELGVYDQLRIFVAIDVRCVTHNTLTEPFSFELKLLNSLY